jgi:hypothetical protein
MVGELIALPVRIGMRATRMWLHAAEGAVSVTASAAEALLDVVTSRRRVRGPDPRDLAPKPDVHSVPATQPPAPEARPRAAPTVEGEDTPAHVSEEPVLVEEFAEPGAEDGAGAQVDVEEPWSGYDEMNAKQVIGRLTGATPAELAAVQLYESGHRGRQTILTAAERELQSANGGRRS